MAVVAIADVIPASALDRRGAFGLVRHRSHRTSVFDRLPALMHFFAQRFGTVPAVSISPRGGLLFDTAGARQSTPLAAVGISLSADRLDSFVAP